MELLVHVNKRLKSRAKVKLPIEALLGQFQDPLATPFVTNFTILYIKMGYPRLDAEKQAELIPPLMGCLEGRPPNHQDSLLQMMIPALQHIKMPRTVQERCDMFRLGDRPLTRRLLLDYMMDVLLLPYSEKALKRVLGESPLSPENLEKAKLGILTFLSSEVMSEAEVACHFVVASSDTRHSVATSADMELKKVMGSVDWNSPEILSKLFSIFQGSVTIKGQVVFDCLFGANLNAKLRSMAVQFVHHMCLNCDDAKFAMFDAVLLSGMVKVISEAKEDPKLRSLAYVAVGKIARRSPHRVAKDIALVQQFFDAMCQEDTETRLAVQEALSMMSRSFKEIDATNLQLLEALLMQNIDKVEPQARVVAVQYAAAVFPSNHVPSRYILMLGAGDVKDDIRIESVKALRGVSGGEEKGDMAALREKSQHKYTVGNAVMPFNPLTYTEIVLYLRMCLAQNAGLRPTPNLTEMQDQAPAVSSYVTQLLSQFPGDVGPISS
nr:hypothetical protein BaRGS_026251 [Batillaria attramentaria]